MKVGDHVQLGEILELFGKGAVGCMFEYFNDKYEIVRSFKVGDVSACDLKKLTGSHPIIQTITGHLSVKVVKLNHLETGLDDFVKTLEIKNANR